MKSLQQKILTLLITSVLVTSILIGGAGIISAQRVITEDSAQIMNMRCEERAQEIDVSLNAIQKVVDMDYSFAMRYLSSDVSDWNDEGYMANYAERVRDELENTARNTNASVAIYLRFNPDLIDVTKGVFLVKNIVGRYEEKEPTDLALYDPTDRERVGWYYEPVANGGPTWMEPYYNRNIGVEMISYARPIYKDDMLIGVIGMDIDLDELKSAVEDLSAYETGYAFLVAADGDIVYHKDYPNGVTAQDSDQEFAEINEILRNGRKESKVYSYTWKGQHKRMVFHRLVNGMYLVLAVPADEIDASRNNLEVQCLIILLAVVLITTLVGIKVIKNITHPLRQLTQAARQITQGDWDVSFGDYKNDEIGVLADTLHTTLEQLRKNIDVANYLAETDTLTGLYNRSYMTKYCRGHMAVNQQQAGVVYCDLNRLKYTNDHLGHAAGDAMICQFVDYLREIFPDEMCCRMGGDEFVVCTFGMPEEDLLHRVARLRDYRCDDGIPMAAIGCFWSEQTEDMDEMLTMAENAMYRDKNAFYDKYPECRR